jgi:V8-like Glu-specific endopeptidase
MKNTTLYRLLCACCPCFAAFAGCGGGVAPATGGSSDHATHAPSTTTRGAETTVDGAIVVDGRTYVPLLEEDNTAAPWGSKLLSEMTVDELAEAMAPRLGYYDGNGGYKLYRALDPSTELAQAIRNDESLPGGPLKRSASGQIVDPSVNEKTQFLLNSINPGVAQTSDARTQPNNHYNYPYSPIVWVQLSNGSFCSGVYVGPNSDTMLTAGHCVRTNKSSHPPSTVTPAAQGGYDPYGSFSGCYYWWYPSGFDTAVSGGCPGTHACDQYDYAVIDYRPCGNPTIASTGTMGFKENTGSSDWASGVYRYGFPGWYAVVGSPPDTIGQAMGTGNPPCGAAANPGGYYPFLCGTVVLPSQSVQFQLFNGSWFGSGYDFETNAITESQGDSGGPFWVVSGTTPYVIALTDTDNQPDGNAWNVGRFIDTTVWNFIFSYANP